MTLKEIAKPFIYTGFAAITALSHPFTAVASTDVEQCMRNAQRAIDAGTGSLGSQNRTKELYLDSFRKQCARDPHAYDALNSVHPKPERRTHAQDQNAEASRGDKMADCMARAKESFSNEQKKMFGAGIDFNQLDAAVPGLMNQINLGVDKNAREQCARDPENAYSKTYRHRKPNGNQVTPKTEEAEQNSVPEGYETRHNNRDAMNERRTNETWAVPQK